ncbi:MAG: DALR domain-containing protein, partial [Candidatus Caldarchaeum sp.]
GGRGMHKSYGNFVTIREMLERYSADVIRVFILSSHYRRPVDYSEKNMEQAEENASKIINLAKNLRFAIEQPTHKPADTNLRNTVQAIYQRFIDAMSEDFNTSEGLAAIYEYVKTVNMVLPSAGLEDILFINQLFEKMCSSLGLLQKKDRKESPAELYELVKVVLDVRRELRKRGIFDLADKIRSMLADRGIFVEDTKDGERVRIGR